MASVTIELPGLLDPITKGERTMQVEADTLIGALQSLVRRQPALAVHLFDESGGLRQHVLCFHNQASSRWMESLDVPVADGDTITLLQAVSGG